MKNIARLTLFLFSLSIVSFAVAADLGPTASLSVSPSVGTTRTTFVFDASDSVDSRGFHDTLEYRWNYNSGVSGWTDWSFDPTTTYQYDDTGTIQIKVEVKDEDGYTDDTWAEIEVSDDLPFETEFNVTPEEGDIYTDFTFDIDTTTTVEYALSDFEYRWDFDGDSEWDTDYMGATEIQHTYGTVGYYTPCLEVLAPDDSTVTMCGYETDSASSGGIITVGNNSEEPDASIEYYPSSGNEDTTFYFSAESSFDSQDYSDLEYRWDYEGDGVFDTDWSSDETTSHKYGVYGEYEVILQIRDSDGNTDEARVDVTIAGEGFAPEAKFTISSDSHLADDDVGTTATEFTFNATSSSDEEDYTSQLEVRWDYEGDSEFDTTWSNNKYAYHQYLEAGEYEVTMEIRDLDGNISSASYEIKVVTNTPPYATFEVDPTSATPGVEFDFDAGACSDDQYKSAYLQVRWDFDGDGTWDTDFATDKTTSHYFDESGEYDAILQVKDPEGQTAEASQSITILSNTSPYADFTVDPESGTYSTSFTFDASNSEDGQTDFDDLWFRWDYDYNGDSDITFDTSFTHTESVSHYFNEDDGTGDFIIRLEVKDEDGEVSTAYETINIHWASTYLEELKDLGIMKGYSGDMKPDQNITRAELLKIVLEATDTSVSGMTYKGYFNDVGKTDWHWKYVEKAYELGIINGYDDGGFKPNQEINRAEALKIIFEGFSIDTSGEHEEDIFDDVLEGYWFFDYVMTAYENDIVSGYGDGRFGPSDSMTRGQAAKVVSLVLSEL